jgi:hypothetical protein
MIIGQEQTDLLVRVVDDVKGMKTITRDQVVAYYNTLSGPIPQRRLDTVAHFTDEINAWLSIDTSQGAGVVIDINWAGANTWKTLKIIFNPDS